MSAPSQQSSSTFNYQHNVETCACGTCHKARVDSGTADAYLNRCKEATKAAMKESKGLKRQVSFMEAALNADIAIAKATAASGGSAADPDFAKNLFSALGTAHDSKCPHGLPFYACMPCSH